MCAPRVDSLELALHRQLAGEDSRDGVAQVLVIDGATYSITGAGAVQVTAGSDA